MSDVRGFAATPHGRKSEKADQIVDATLKTLDLVGGMFELHLHGQPAVTGRADCPVSRARISCRNSPGGTKNGLCWRMPPTMTNGCVRMMSLTASPLNFERLLLCSYQLRHSIRLFKDRSLRCLSKGGHHQDVRGSTEAYPGNASRCERTDVRPLVHHDIDWQRRRFR